MTKKTLLYLIIYSSGLIQASSIIHKAISHIPEIENVSAVMHTSSQLHTTQAGRLNMTQALHFADDYKRYLRTGKGDPLLYNLISDDSLKNGYQPLGLTAADVRKIKSFLVIEHTQKKITSVFLDSEIFAFPNLPNWLALEYKNVTNEIFSGINYKRYYLGPDDACQGIGEALAPRLLEDLDGIRSYFYCKKDYIGINRFIENEKSRIELAFLYSINIGKYVFVDIFNRRQIKEKISRSNNAIKYLIVLYEDTILPEINDFLNEIFANYSDLVLVLAFKDTSRSIRDNFLKEEGVISNMIIAGKGITTVGKNFFRNSSSLKSLDLPQGITHVGDDFLFECNNLQTLNISQSITEVGNTFLFKCSNLRRVDLPKDLTQIGDWFLSQCSNLQTLDIPQNITQISTGFLNKCDNLRTVNLPKNLTKVGTSFLTKCSKLIMVNLPKKLTEIGDYFLYECSSLTTLDVPEGIKKISYGFLAKCTDLKTVVLPQNLIQVGDHFLAECSSLQTLDLPQGITEVGKSFLSKCRNLRTVELPQNLTQVGDYFLYECTSLQTLDLPQNITQIGDSFLAKCSKLQDVKLPLNLTQIGNNFLKGCTSLKELTLTKALYDKIHNEFQDVKFKFYENEHQSLEPEEIGAAAAAAKSA